MLQQKKLMTLNFVHVLIYINGHRNEANETVLEPSEPDKQPKSHEQRESPWPVDSFVDG